MTVNMEPKNDAEALALLRWMYGPQVPAYKASDTWKTAIANAIARDPKDRSPAERAVIRRLVSGSQHGADND